MAEFEMDLAGNLVRLSDALRDGTYRPLPYTRFVVHGPKRRVVHSLRYRDRVVQHALCDNVLAPVIEPRLVYDNAACRVGKGTHFAFDRLKHGVHKTRAMVATGTIEPGKALESFQSHRAHLSHAHAHGLMTSIDWSVARVPAKGSQRL